MDKELRSRIKSVDSHMNPKEVKELVEKDPCFALLVLQDHGTATRTGELFVMYFGGREGLHRRAANVDCKDVDLGILGQV